MLLDSFQIKRKYIDTIEGYKKYMGIDMLYQNKYLQSD
jgi:hypothetical protein